MEAEPAGPGTMVRNSKDCESLIGKLVDLSVM